MYASLISEEKREVFQVYAQGEKIYIPRNYFLCIETRQDFPGGAVVNPPANAGDTGLSPAPRRSHMPRSN